MEKKENVYELHKQNNKEDNKNVPSDAIIGMNSHNKLFEHRHNFSKLLDIKEFDFEKEGYERYGAPLSAWDKVNQNALTSSPSVNFMKNFMQNNSTEFDNKFNKGKEKSLNFNSFSESVNNFYLQKRTISLSQKNGYYYNPNGKIYQSEKHKLIRKNLTFSYDKIKKNFMTVSEDKKYPRSYLPEPGFGLLQNPFPPVAKKKKKRSMK